MTGIAGRNAPERLAELSGIRSWRSYLNLSVLSQPDIRFSDKIQKGYELSDCGDMFARYIAVNSQHPQQVNESNDLDSFSNPQQTENVADQKSDSSIEKQSNVADVADWTTKGEACVDGRETVDEAWAKIRAEHEAKKRVQQSAKRPR